MKKKIKMLLMVLVSLSVFFVTGSVSFAYDGDFNELPRLTDGTEYDNIENDKKGYFSGAREATEEDIIESLSQPKKNELEFEEVNKIPTKSGWYFLNDIGTSFTYYGQEKKYTCGPACVKMALKYLTGITYSELTIENACNTSSQTGTLLSNMKTYINSEQNINTYYNQYLADLTTMKNNLFSGIVTYDAPPIIGVKELGTWGFPYELEKHFVLVYGVKDDKSEMAIADPWAGFKNEYNHSTYSIFAGNLHLAYSQNNLGYMY